MIDNIKITLTNFSGNFNKCDYIGEGKYDSLYTLPSHGISKSTKLFVRQNRNTKKVVITRSIRKWYFNKGSLLDLTEHSFTKAMRRLAKDLNITLSELCKGKVTQCEIGQNVRVKIPATEIVPKIVNYRHIERKPIKDETVYFNGKAKKLIIYDKLAEIGAKGNKSKRGTMQILKEKGYHFLRIEFKLFNQKSFNQHEMRHISTIGDLIIHFSNLYEFWTHQINQLIVFSTIEKDMQNMTQQEYLIGLGLNTSGFVQFVEEYRSLCKSKTKRGLIEARKKAYKEILDVLKKYGSRKEYGKNSLRVDVAKHLLRKSKQEEIDLPFLFHNLWGTNA